MAFEENSATLPYIYIYLFAETHANSLVGIVSSQIIGFTYLRKSKWTWNLSPWRLIGFSKTLRTMHCSCDFSPRSVFDSSLPELTMSNFLLPPIIAIHSFCSSVVGKNSMEMAEHIDDVTHPGGGGWPSAIGQTLGSPQLLRKCPPLLPPHSETTSNLKCFWCWK